MGGIRYGDESQFRLLAPDCGFFASNPTLHYFLLVYLPITELLGIFVNSWIIYILTGGGATNKMLQQSQHVYVLGTAITNIALSFGVIGFWSDQFVAACVYKGLFVCGFKNLLQFSGGYQMVFNVCLVCLDRYRLVTLGVKYNHQHEVKRAKWLLAATSLFSALLFLVPEIVTPLITGQISAPLSPGDYVKCLPSQKQIVLGNQVSNVVAVAVIAGSLAFFVPCTLMTAYALYSGQRKAAAAVAAGGTASQMADSRKLLRASLIMFGMVGSLLLTWGPLTIAQLLVDVDYTLVSPQLFYVLVAWQDTAPLVDPFAFALTLPQLRAQARRTAFGRAVVGLLSLKLRKSNETSTAGTNTHDHPPPAERAEDHQAAIAVVAAATRQANVHVALPAVTSAL